jgi:dCTP deaminase
MILNDAQITELALKGMIQPFKPYLVRRAEIDGYPGVDSGIPVLSYGLSSYGYDIRLSSKDFRIFRHLPGTVIDPKNFNPLNLESVTLMQDHNGSYFIIPGHSYALGVAFERLELPQNVTAICLAKSTYARISIATNITPAEAGWKGNLTLEIANNCGADVRVYANEGIAQMLFFRGEACSVSYEDRKGKYQEQPEQIVFAKV